MATATGGEEAAFVGKWMDGDGAVVIIQAEQLLWPDGSTCETSVKGDTLQLLGGGIEIAEGKLSSDGGWLVWSDGDTWVRMLGGAEGGACIDDDGSDDDGSDDDDDDVLAKVGSAGKIQTQDQPSAEKVDVSTSDSEDDSDSSAPTESKDTHTTDQKEPVAAAACSGAEVEKVEQNDRPSEEELQRRQRQQEEEEEELRYMEEEELLMQKWDAWDHEAAPEGVAEPKPLEVQAEREAEDPPSLDQQGAAEESELGGQAVAEEGEESGGGREAEPDARDSPAPQAPAKVIDEPLTGEFPLERVIDDPMLDALESPREDLMKTLFTEPLKYKVSWKQVILRKEPSTQSLRLAILAHGDQITGYQQGHWLSVVGKTKGWLLLDGSRMGLGQLVEHQYLQLRVQQTFSQAVLLEWDRLPGARFVDYAVQWSYPSDPENITTAASHIPRPCAKVTGLPSNVKLQFRLCACIYTDTKSNGGERFAVLVGKWFEAETVDEPTVDALVDPRPEKMPDIYATPLDFAVRFKQVVVRYSPSTKAKAYGTLPAGREISGYPQGNWIFMTKPVRGWVLIDGDKQGFGLLIRHKYLEPTIVRTFSEAALIEWAPLPGAKFVDYSLQYTHSETSNEWTMGTEHIARPIGLIHKLSPDDKVWVRVCAQVYTQTKGNNGQYFTTVFGPSIEVETEMAVTSMEEESLCLDPMANLRGRCMDCDCRGLVGTQLDMEVKPRNTMEDSVVCRRCGCSCVRHMIIGEYQYRRTGTAQTPSAFKLPQRIIREVEREAEQAQKALTSGESQTSAQGTAKTAAPSTWRPEDSGLDGDRLGFTLDRIAEARNLYETLGVLPDCDDKDIRHAHRRIALFIHPDKVVNRNDTEILKQAESAFKIVSAAYEVLSDPLKRGAYNQSIRTLGGSSTGGSKPSTRKDLTAATLLRRFLSKAMWGWDLQAKPPGDWEEFGKGVYGKSRQVSVTVLHAITKEETKFNLDRGTLVQTLKACIVSRVKRGPASSIELATAEGEELQDDHHLSSSVSLVLAGISSLGPSKDVKLLLSHADTGARHYVEVPDTSTIAEIKELAAKSLKVRSGLLRLGCRSNTRDKLQDFEDNELLNGRSQMLVLGVHIPIKLSVEEATELQLELLQAYSEVSFQAELDTLLAQFPPLDGLINPEFKERWDYLLKHAQKNILLKHGFDGPHGAMTMMAAFHDVNYHEEVQRNASSIDAKLRITRGTALPPVVAILVQPADEDCDSDDEVQRGVKVVLLKGSNIGHLKEAIAKRLHEDVSKIEVVTMGKPELFSKVPRSCTVHKDEEAVGGRRLFQVRGIKMPPQEDLNNSLKEQERKRRDHATEEAKVRRKEEELAAWEALKDCRGCKKQLKAIRGHIAKDDHKWYCNQCWSQHHKMDGRHNAAHAILTADTIAAADNAIDRDTRTCTTPGCKYRMHRNMRLGAYIYCCVACKEGIGHSFACERRDPLREDTPEPRPEEQHPTQEAKKEPPNTIEKRAIPAAIEPVKPTQSTKAQAPTPAASTASSAEAKPVQTKPVPVQPEPKPKESTLATVSAKEEKASEGQQEVSVEVISANQADLRVPLKLQSTATWLEVKRALAWRIGRPDVMQSGKLATKGQDGFYSSLDDFKAIKESQEIFLMNADLSYNPNSWDINAEEYKRAEKRRQQPAEKKKPAAKEEKETTVTIKDLRTGTGFDMRVLKTMTALEIRQAVAFATNRSEDELMEGKLLKRGGDGYLSLTEHEIAGDKKSLWMLDVDIAPKKGSPADKFFLKKGMPVMIPQVETARATALEQAAKEGDEEGWRMIADEAKDPELVMVTITHATSKTDPTTEVVVMDNCLLSDVMEALADRANRPEVLRLGRFVERKGAASYKNIQLKEPLKKRRELLLHGVELKPKR